LRGGQGDLAAFLFLRAVQQAFKPGLIDDSTFAAPRRKSLMAEQDPHVADFLREVRRQYRPDAPDSFWTCEAAFRTMLSSPFLSQVLNAELRNLAAGKTQTSWVGNELVLHRGGGFALSVSLLEVPQRYVHSLPYHAMYAPVSGEGLHCRTYRFPPNYRNAVFDPSLSLTPAGESFVPSGSALLLDCDRFAYDLSADTSTPVLKFMTSAIQPLEWLFSRNGLQAWQANDSDLTFTQLRVAADVLGRFAHQSSLAPLKSLTNHAHHAVRWGAIQNLARLSRSEAMVRLKEAVNDPHPHVQRAAQKTLQKMGSK
jgi:hypothetical protein